MSAADFLRLTEHGNRLRPAWRTTDARKTGAREMRGREGSGRNVTVLRGQGQEGFWIAVRTDFFGQDAGDGGRRLDCAVCMQKKHSVAPCQDILDRPRVFAPRGMPDHGL